jgi:AhpD family alkylhydroperoxidase
MKMRVDYRSVFPIAIKAMAGLEEAVHESSLDAELLELVKLRASQLNGCGYCVDMHTKDAKGIGVEDQRLHLVVAWKEAPVYSPRERAALAWCEVLTMLPSSGAPDDVYEQVAGEFSPEEIVALTLAIVAINGWNRFAVGLRSPVGSYVQGDSTGALP